MLLDLDSKFLFLFQGYADFEAVGDSLYSVFDYEISVFGGKFS